MRSASPSRVNLCPDCGEECLPTAFGAAEHHAKHLEWEATNVHGASTHFARRMVAWRAVAEEGEIVRHQLREQINVLFDRIEDLEAQLDLIHRQDAGMA